MKTVILLIFFPFLPLPGCSTGSQDDEQVDEKINRLKEVAFEKIRKNDFDGAARDLTELLKLKPEFSLAYYNRGRVRFQSGDVKGAIADFDRHVKLSPEYRAQQWERGIALYYAGKFEEGAAQFKIYQTYHDNDVENSAWRFLCQARAESIESARKNLLPINNDGRVPMMQIYRMYQGKMTPNEVLEAAENLSKGDIQKNSARFYANLYVGLLHEAEGKHDLALKHIEIARKYRIEHYMWNVADVHLELLKKATDGAGRKKLNK